MLVVLFNTLLYSTSTVRALLQALANGARHIDCETSFELHVTQTSYLESLLSNCSHFLKLATMTTFGKYKIISFLDCKQLLEDCDSFQSTCKLFQVLLSSGNVVLKIHKVQTKEIVTEMVFEYLILITIYFLRLISLCSAHVFLDNVHIIFFHLGF